MEPDIPENSGSDDDYKSYVPKRGLQMPTAEFKVNDAVSMSIKSSTGEVRGNFKVAARKDNAAKRRWEYQLKDAHGILHANGAWIPEARLSFQG